MTTAGLQKKIAEVLGVSSSEKELAFEIFILKVCEILTEDVTLKVQRIGFFQLKKNVDESTCTLLFIPLSEDLYRESKNLFLTIPLPSHYHKEKELDPDVFSIGVGKPILPLSGNDATDTETSYAILRKSIEERVNEILASSDQLPNFNIWDDYYKSVKYVEHPSSSKTDELNADAEFKEEFMAEGLAKNLLELNSFDDHDDSKESPPQEVSLNDLLEGYNAVDSQIEEVPEISSTNEELDFEELKNELSIEEELTVDIDNDSDELDNALQKVIDDIEKNTDETIAGLTDHIVEEEFSEASQKGENLHIDESSETENPGDALQKVIDDVEKNSDETITGLTDHIDEEELSEISTGINEQTDEYLFHQTEEKISEEIELAQEIENVDVNEIIADLAADNEEHVEETEESYSTDEEQYDDSLEIEVPTKSKDIFYEIKHESKLDEVDLDKVNEEDNEQNYYLGLKRKDDEPIEWDWGDELKEEFGVEFLKEEQKQRTEDEEEKRKTDEVETVDEIFKTTQHVRSTLFDELETTVKKEIEEAEEPHQVLEYSGESRRFHFVEEQQLEPSYEDTQSKYPTGTRFESTDEILEEFNNEKGFSFGKTFLIIFSSFVIVVALIIYFIIDNKEQPDKLTQTIPQTDSVTSQQLASSDSSQIYNDEYSDFPRVASIQTKQESGNLKPETNLSSASKESAAQPITTKPESGNGELYRTTGTDTRVNKNIYYDGREYNFQVSSWRNRLKAEQEVQRLRNKGYDAFVIEAFLPEKGGTWFRVRIGNFKSVIEAEQFSTNKTF